MLRLIINMSFLFKVELLHLMTTGKFFKLFLLTWAFPLYFITVTSTECEIGLTHHVDSTLCLNFILGQNFGFIVSCINNCLFEQITYKALEEQITNSNVSYPFSFIRNDWW